MMGDERYLELRAQAKDGDEVARAITSPGWTYVIAPGLKERRESLVEKLLSATRPEDFIRLQQAANAIDNLIVFIEGLVELGKQSAKECEEAGAGADEARGVACDEGV